MLVIEEMVMPMMMDAVVRVPTEMTEANRSSVIDEMFIGVEEEKKKLQFCFGSKLYQRLCACQQTSLLSNMQGGSSHGVDRLKMAMGVNRMPCQLRKAFSWMLMMLPVRQRRLHMMLIAICIKAQRKQFGGGGTDVASPMALVAGVNNNIHTLVPYGDNEEEVDLSDDDVAFSLRSMFAEAGGSRDSAEQASPSTGVGVDATRVSTDEAYARELESKLEKTGNIKLETCACSW